MPDTPIILTEEHCAFLASPQFRQFLINSRHGHVKKEDHEAVASFLFHIYLQVFEDPRIGYKFGTPKSDTQDNT